MPPKTPHGLPPNLPTLNALDYKNPETQRALQRYVEMVTRSPAMVEQHTTLFLSRANSGYPNSPTVAKHENADAILATEGARALTMRDTMGGLECYNPAPFINLAALPSKMRPATFTQCVDFFYPSSGPTKYPQEGSPFISTYIDSYDVRRRDVQVPALDSIYGVARYLETNRLPIDLGDVSMMYGWFLVYRLLLCPKTFGAVQLPNANTIFKAVAGERSVEPHIVQSTMKRAKALHEDYTRKKKILAQAQSVVNSLANMQGDITADSVMRAISEDVAVRALLAEGANALVQELVQTTAIPKAVAAQLGAQILAGEMPKHVLDSQIDTDMGNLLTHAQNSLENSYGLPRDAAYALRRTYLTGEAPDLSSIADPRIRAQAEAFARERAQARADIFRGGISDAYDSAAKTVATKQAVAAQSAQAAADALNKEAARGLARPNGLLVGLGAALVSTAVGAYVDYQYSKMARDLSAQLKYWVSAQLQLNPALTEEGITFALDSFAHSGVKSDGGWAYKPRCAPVQDKNLALYWQSIWEIYLPMISKMRARPTALKSILQNGNCAPGTAGDPRCQPLESLETIKSAGFACAFTYRLFIRNAVKSTQLILDKLPAYSNFTRAFGFAPVFYAGPHPTMPNEGLVYVSGAPELHGYEYTAQRKGEYTAPDQSRLYAWWGTGGQPKASTKPVISKWKARDIRQINRPDMGTTTAFNSQRRMAADDPTYGFYDSRTRLSFDVAQDVPVFNAQWAAMMSVIFCYPEALETLAAAGYDWAAPVLAARSKAMRGGSTGKLDQLRPPASMTDTLRTLTTTAQLPGGRLSPTVASATDLPRPTATPPAADPKTPKPVTSPAKGAKKAFAETSKKAQAGAPQSKSSDSEGDLLTPTLTTAAVAALLTGASFFALKKFKPETLKKMSKRAKITAAAGAGVFVAGSGAAAYLIAKNKGEK